MIKDNFDKRCITATTFIIDKESKRMLFIFHKKLNKWLPTGGHVEQNEFPNEAAIREAKEESGLDIRLIDLDVDISRLKIDDSIGKNQIRPFVIVLEDVVYPKERHQHFDMVYVALAEGSRVNISAESSAYRWVDKQELDSIDTFDNVKATARAIFDKISNLDLSRF
ncbi:MAG: DNA mismatch repair protein MutT [Candidatus Micrarchaeota archaeon]|nr:MAG: DNA mismatch repair protein MutT [Candidatus Micrarchaeota archaeon]